MQSTIILDRGETIEELSKVLKLSTPNGYKIEIRHLRVVKAGRKATRHYYRATVIKESNMAGIFKRYEVLEAEYSQQALENMTHMAGVWFGKYSKKEEENAD